jgi:hypothetical protein
VVMSLAISTSESPFSWKWRTEAVRNLMSSRTLAASILILSSSADSTKRMFDLIRGLSSSIGYDSRVGTGLFRVLSKKRSHSKVKAIW